MLKCKKCGSIFTDGCFPLYADICYQCLLKPPYKWCIQCERYVHTKHFSRGASRCGKCIEATDKEFITPTALSKLKHSLIQSAIRENDHGFLQLFN